MASPKLNEQSPNSAAAPPAVAWHHYVFFIAVAAVLVILIAALQPILMPFFAGALLAYLGSPLVERMAEPRRFKKLRCSRSVGALIVMLLLLSLVALLLIILIPLVQSEALTMAAQLPAWFDHFTENVVPRIEKFLGVSLAVDFQSWRALLSEHLSGVSKVSLTVLTGLKNSGQALFALIINCALIPVVMFYLLRDWKALTGQLDDLIPRRWHQSMSAILSDIDAVLAEFVRGQALVMLSLSLYYVVLLWLVGLKLALPIGILTGLLVFIPYVGFSMGMVLALLSALIQPEAGVTLVVAVAVVYGVGQLLESYVLTPYLVGDRIGLHPLAVIFALLAFGELFGFVGILLALPVSAALLVVLRLARAAYLKSPIYTNKT